MDKNSVREIKGFVNRLRRQFDPEKIILFGSKVSDDNWKWSDYDFIVVSSHFEGMHWLDRISKIIALWDLPIDIDVLPYTPQEFIDKKENSSVVRSALKHSKLIE